KKFHAHHYECLIATTVLERGITIKGIHVVIYQADHPVFNEASLIQMIGRVGRNIEMPTGRGLFLCTKKTRDIERCIRALQLMNG
ncbi:helicase, partial [Erysipelatoclostridium ramosum]